MRAEFVQQTYFTYMQTIPEIQFQLVQKAFEINILPQFCSMYFFIYF